MTPRLISALGIVALVCLASLLSANRSKIRIRQVFVGVVTQLVIAFLVLRTPPGQFVFDSIEVAIAALMSFVDAGSAFLFGSGDLPFAFKVLPAIVVFSSFISILYYIGIMQRFIGFLSWILRRLFGISGIEGLATAANVFVGQSEAPLAVRPYLDRMSDSELMTIMVGGFSTVAGSTMAAYVAMGMDPGHVAAASIISAPAAITIAKIMQPEVQTLSDEPAPAAESDEESVNLIHAATQGATNGMRLALNIAAMLLAFLALVAVVDTAITSASQALGFDWTLGSILGFLFYPIAFLMGVERGDCQDVGYLLGLRMATNEFVAFAEIGNMELAERSKTIATFALCGFATISSIGVQLGALGPLMPNKQATLARFGVRAMIGGTIACCMTGCVAGILL